MKLFQKSIKIFVLEVCYVSVEHCWTWVSVEKYDNAKSEVDNSIQRDVAENTIQKAKNWKNMNGMCNKQ